MFIHLYRGINVTFQLILQEHIWERCNCGNENNFYSYNHNKKSHFKIYQNKCHQKIILFPNILGKIFHNNVDETTRLNQPYTFEIQFQNL